jgi:hypothetical protein
MSDPVSPLAAGKVHSVVWDASGANIELKPTGRSWTASGGMEVVIMTSSPLAAVIADLGPLLSDLQSLTDKWRLPNHLLWRVEAMADRVRAIAASTAPHDSELLALLHEAWVALPDTKANEDLNRRLKIAVTK